MIGPAPSEARPLLMLAQDGAQASSHEAIEGAEHGWPGMFEVTKPSPKHRVEVVDDPSEAVASTAARLHPHLVPQRLQALLADQPPACLEPVAEEVEPLPRLSAVANPRLVRMQR